MENSVSLLRSIPGLQNDGDWQAVSAALEELPDNGILKLNAMNRPDGLLGFLEERGYRTSVQQWHKNAWGVEILASGVPDIVDLRDLEAPEPMERILIACAKLDPGMSFLARLPHVPHPLFPHLKSRNLQWQVLEEPDESALLLVRRRI